MALNTLDPSNLSLEKYHRALSIVCYVLIGGLLFITGFFHFFLREQFGQTPELIVTLQIAALVVYSISMAVVLGLVPRRMALLKELSGKAEKLRGHQQNSIIRFAAIEGSALFCLIGYVITGNVFLLAGVALGIALLIVFRPTKVKILTETGLSESDFS
jgi:hypothetical protein